MAELGARLDDQWGLERAFRACFASTIVIRVANNNLINSETKITVS